MHYRLRLVNSPVVLLLALASVSLGACAAPAAERVVVAGGDTSPTGVSVTGFGEVLARPDIGRMSIGVEARAAGSEDAAAQANTQMNAVLAALKGAGVADKDLRTSRISLNRDYQPQPPVPLAAPAPTATPTKGGKPVPPPPTPSGYEVYRASTSVEVTLRDLDKAGQVIAAATRAGANDVGGIELTLDDPAPAERQARDKAMADAKARAEQLAKLAGVTLGPVLAIQEMAGGGYSPRPMAAMMKSEAGGAAPVERGEIRVTRQIEVRFAIGK